LSWIKVDHEQTLYQSIVRAKPGDAMIRAASILFSLPVMAVALFVAHFSGDVSPIEAMLAILAIVCFAVIATGWTVDHDVSD
jgi:hypothetical protein